MVIMVQTRQVHLPHSREFSLEMIQVYLWLINYESEVDISHFKIERKTRYKYDSLFSSHGGQAEILFGLNYSPLTGKLPHKYYTDTQHYLRTIIGWTVEGITLQKSNNTKGARYFCNIDFTWWQLQGKVISPQSHPNLTPIAPQSHPNRT